MTTFRNLIGSVQSWLFALAIGIVVTLCTILIGCVSENENATTGASARDTPRFTVVENLGGDAIDKQRGNNSWILEDTETGVLYLFYDGYKQAAMTVLYNADGSVMTKDNL